VPPFLGFWAKWAVLREVIAAGHTWLAVVAVAFSVVGLFYYLRVVRHVYFDEPSGEVVVAPGQDLRVMLSSNALVILALGVYPGALMGLCISALN
jgi:NADH-quinone oxidoreductase subunit N